MADGYHFLPQNAEYWVDYAVYSAGIQRQGASAEDELGPSSLGLTHLLAHLALPQSLHLCAPCSLGLFQGDGCPVSSAAIPDTGSCSPI